MAEPTENTGHSVLNAAALGAPEEPYTLIVCGLARSGTTMVAAVLRRLGILCPEASDNEVMEDVALAHALAARDRAATTAIARERDFRYLHWAAKRPDFYKHMGRLDRLLRRPRYIVPFRDIAAIAARNRLSVQQPILAGLGRAADDLVGLVNTIHLSPSPILVLSYEKALLNPTAAARSIASFCGLETLPCPITELAALIVADEAGYRETARFRFEGRLGRVAEGILEGWVRCTAHEQPVMVDLIVNGVARSATRAARERTDGPGRTFRIRLPPDVRASDMIAVRVSESAFELEGSGRPLAALAGG